MAKCIMYRKPTECVLIQLKGCKNVKKDVEEMLILLHLEHKRHKQSRTLSGGMKRKLCVGIALIGGSKVGLDR